MFYLKNNECIKRESCIIGQNEKCKSCKEEVDLIHHAKHAMKDIIYQKILIRLNV